MLSASAPPETHPAPGSNEERLADLVAGVSVAFVCVPQARCTHIRPAPAR